MLELGCGTGLLGLTLLKTLPIASYTFTDCHFRVINAVIQNIELNMGGDNHNYEHRLKQLQTGPDSIVSEETVGTVKYEKNLNNSSIKVRHLDWTDANSSNLDFSDFDLLLAADVVYERSLLPHLCNVISKFLHFDPRSDDSAFVSCTERSPTTLSEFERCLDESDLEFEICFRGRYSPGSSLLSSDVQHQFTRVYRITTKKNE